MTQAALAITKPKRRRYSSYPGEVSPAAENLIDRGVQAPAPNAKWLTDFTEFHIRAAKVDLSPIIDCFDGLVISWAIGSKPEADLVNTGARCGEQPILHSDRGAHYRWRGWLARVGDAKLVRSMSRKAHSQDNAACEGFFGRLNTEFIWPRDWRAFTAEPFINEVEGYSRWYTETGIKMCLGSRSQSNTETALAL